MKVNVEEEISSGINSRTNFPLIAKFKADGTIVLFTAPEEGVHLFIGQSTTVNATCYCGVGEYSKDMNNINNVNILGGYLWEILDSATLKFENE